MKNTAGYVIASAAMVSLMFVFPRQENPDADTGTILVLLLLAGAGTLLSRILVLSSSSSDRTGIEPSMIVFIASWGNLPFIFPVVALFSFAGSVINSIRSERHMSSPLAPGLYQGVSFALLLRLGHFIYRDILGFLAGEGAVAEFLAMALAAMLLTFLRTLSVHLTESNTGGFAGNLRRNLFINGFILLPGVPGALWAWRHPDTVEMLVMCATSLLAIVSVHTISIILNRSAHERTGELETVLRLRELSGSLFSATTEMDALRILSRSLSAAWQCPSAVQWKSLKYSEGEPWNTERGVSLSHPEGLTVWVDSFNSTVPEYLESFVNRTVPVLAGLEAEKRMKHASWRSVETMISFLEENRSDFAGLSRRTAATAERLCGLLGMNSWFRDCVRLAGLLHKLELGGESGDQPLALPEITTSALRHMEEHWRGTGPQGLKGEEIPVEARILAVSAGWERACSSGRDVAARDLKMRSGTQYDPGLVEMLVDLCG